MPTYVALIDFTPQGLQRIDQSPKRAAEFSQWAESNGVKVKDLYWTAGAHDGVLIIDALDDTSAASTFLKLASAGNVRTQSMRAFDRDEFEACLPN